ncbi:MAG: CRISPR-associated helicase Cas3' [Bacteroidetes bacterium]|nr:CRISPR-associated helicase Cas3' [Bacteroidota bacterium]
MNEILAKSEPQLTLHEHIQDCLKIHSFLKVQFADIAKLPNIPSEFWEFVRISMIFHDLGKSHREFQNLLKGEESKWKKQRHELFSLPFLMAFDGIEDKAIKNVMLLAIAGHHKDYEQLFSRYINGFYQDETPNDGLELDLGTTESITYVSEFKKVDVNAIRTLLREKYQIELKQNLKAENQLKFIKSYNRNSITIKSSDYWFLVLLFGAIKNCDHLGSARVQNIASNQLSDFQFLTDYQVELHSKSLDFYQHQKDCSQTLGNVILTAPTGSGKTESAFLWVRKHFEENQTGRIFYVLPFTASINAMFERLSAVVEEGKVGMLHGKLSSYLNDYFEEHQYSHSSKKEAIDELKQKFKYVTTPIKVSTPFQLLKHIFGLKGFEQGLFEWTNSYFIFDEIHAYDAKTFAQIKVLLEFVTKYLNVKVMIMTATLPKFLREEIELAIGQFTPINADQTLYNSFRRHKVILQEGLLENNLDLIKADIQAGKKVLVVCNTVPQAQKIYGILRNEVEKSVLLHGSFNGIDRNKHEQTLLKAEKDDTLEDVMLLVGTQAIEVSLDIDYEIIYTEPAPIDALLQRFGRVNRKRERGISPCVIFKENNKTDFYIYDKEVISRTLEVFSDAENDGIVDESILQEYIDFVYPSWSKEQAVDFKQVYETMNSTLDLLVPLLHSKKTEEDFYKQFDGAKILPQIYKSKFEEYLRNFDFINAENLKVSIKKNRFRQWLSSQNLRKEVFAFEKNKKGDLLTIEYFITNKFYDPYLGLLKNEELAWEDDNMF